MSLMDGRTNAALCRLIAKRVGVAWVTGARNQLARHPPHRHDGAGSTDPRTAGFAEMQARPMAFASLPGWTTSTRPSSGTRDGAAICRGSGAILADDVVWEAPDTLPTGGVPGRDAVLEQ